MFLRGAGQGVVQRQGLEQERDDPAVDTRLGSRRHVPSNPLTRQFGKAPADSSFNGVVLFARTGIPEILQTSVQKPQVVGSETIRDKSTLHLKGEVRGDKLNPLMGTTLKPELMYPVDLWMEEQSANPVRIHVTEPAGNGWLIELFATNEPVEIPTPKLPPATPKP